MKCRFLTSVRVKEDECLTHGVCESELPQIFHLPEDGGTARVLESALNHYTELQSEIERVAAEICPVEAIHLVYSDGSERFPPGHRSAVQAHTLGPNLWPWRALAVFGFVLVVLFLCSRA